MKDFVSVIIPHYNDWSRLYGCLTRLREQTWPADRYEVLVIDNASSDPRPRNIDVARNVRFLSEDEPGSYAARNTGITAAAGNILAFTDSDCRPTPNWLENGARILCSMPDPGFIGGAIRFSFSVAGHPNAWELYDSLTHLNQQDYVENKGYAATANMFTTRDVFDRCGRFDANLLSGGDKEWGRRVSGSGFSARYASDAVVLHPARSTFADIRAKARRLSGGEHAAKLSGGEKINFPGPGALLPPLREILSKALTASDLGYAQRLNLAAVIMLAKYVRTAERFRLAAGGRPAR